jgi:hypothetical protein
MEVTNMENIEDVITRHWLLGLWTWETVRFLLS